MSIDTQNRLRDAVNKISRLSWTSTDPWIEAEAAGESLDEALSRLFERLGRPENMSTAQKVELAALRHNGKWEDYELALKRHLGETCRSLRNVDPVFSEIQYEVFDSAAAVEAYETFLNVVAW
jgi:hypothetical protein